MCEFSANALVRVEVGSGEKQEFQAKISCGGGGVLSVTFTSPKELEGLSVRWSDGFEMSYLGLELQSEKMDFLPAESFPRVLRQVVMNLPQNGELVSFEGDVARYRLSCDNVECTVETDGNGYITQISAEEIKLAIELYY